MKESRRQFIKNAGSAVLFGGLGIPLTAGEPQIASPKMELGGYLAILDKTNKDHYKPLETLTISTSEKGKLRCLDGQGNPYYETPIANKIDLVLGGALGHQLFLLLDGKDRLLDVLTVPVDCYTEIKDSSGEFEHLWELSRYCALRHPSNYVKVGSTMYKIYAGWFQDHLYSLKAQKYYDNDVVSGSELFAVSQRANGMVADNCKHPLSSYTSWATRFGDDFVWLRDNKEKSDTIFVRIPIENMGEFTFLLTIYETWKITGEHSWMAGKIEACKKAIDYATSDPYRWSEKFQLPKRGYTIDIWDFQPRQLAAKFGGDIMMAEPGITDYSIMYGDTVGLARGCEHLAEMLIHLGRTEEAKKYADLGKTMLERLEKLAWTGTHYLHHVFEDASRVPDFGETPLEEQVTISSAYAINRGIGHDKAAALIRTYQKIREEMPESSPGEWYLCYPPYEKGWHVPKWEYMNGGVSPIVGGELAHGAFWHGFEAYGVDCLRRISALAKKSDNKIECIYRGNLERNTNLRFQKINLLEVANADTHGTGSKNVPGFIGEGNNDLSNFPKGDHELYGVPFHFIAPETNGRKACLLLSDQEGYPQRAEIEVNDTMGSLYLVHAQHRGDHIGSTIIHYEDGNTSEHYFKRGDNIDPWWFVEEKLPKRLRIAANVTNAKSRSVGAFVYGFNNPHPEKSVKSIVFQLADTDGKWIILGATLGKEKVSFAPNLVSYGAPDSWASAAVHYALMEGLAGVKNTGTAFTEATLAPRWLFTDTKTAKVTAKFPASNGYMCYHYTQTDNMTIEVLCTGCSKNTLCLIPIPKERNIKTVSVNQKVVAHTLKEVENTTYVNLTLTGIGVYEVKVQLG